MSEKKTLDLTTDNISKCLLLLSIPIFGSQILRCVCYFLKMVWTGTLGSQALAALSASITILWITLGLIGIYCKDEGNY